MSKPSKRHQAIQLIRQELEFEKTRPEDSYVMGRISGLRTALYYLDEPQTVREYEETIASQDSTESKARGE